MAEDGATVQGLLDAAAGRLRAVAGAEARREAWRIWADLQGLSGPSAPGERERMADREEALRYARAVARRTRGEPLPYVTGVAGFRRLTLHSDPRALIPRPETEGLVELLLERQPTGRIADVGTGTGCVALALADEGHYDLVLGLDRSRRALALAEANRRLAARAVLLAAGDLLSAVAADSLDAVVSNPPYLTEAEYAGLDRSVREWEPAEALVSGADGLTATRRLVTEAFPVVRRGGWLGLEVDASRASEVARVAALAGWSEPVVHMDLFGRARYLLARRSEAE